MAKAKKCPECAGLEKRVKVLETICTDLHWMARRYCDNRSSYAPGLFNEHVRTLLELGIALNPGAEGTIWASDSMGRDFDELTDAQATPGTDEALGEVVAPSRRVHLRDELVTLLGTPDIREAVNEVRRLKGVGPL